jgi:hypothetical protein
MTCTAPTIISHPKANPFTFAEREALRGAP